MFLRQKLHCVFRCCDANRFPCSAFVFFQASAVLARKKAKELHKDIVTFWQKKKTSKSAFPGYWMLYK